LEGINRADLSVPKIFPHRAICDGLFAECGYEIVVDDSGRPALPVEMEDN
jgi:hypothetical protein